MNKDGQLRLTWQASSKNKIGLIWHEAVTKGQGPSATTAVGR
jgi:hypothetical protein